VSRSQPESSATTAIVGMGSRGYCWRTPEGSAPAVEQGNADAVRQALASLPVGTTVNVVAGHDTAVHWLQTPPASLQSMEELRLVAAARCSQLYGGTARDWWIAGDWNAAAPFACAALARSQVGTLDEALAAAGLRVRWQSVWGLVCGHHADQFPATGWSALRTPERIVAWHCLDGRINAITTLAIDPQADAAEAQRAVASQIQLEGLRDSALPQGPVHWHTIAAEHEAAAALAAGISALVGARA